MGKSENLISYLVPSKFQKKKNVMNWMCPSSSLKINTLLKSFFFV